MNEVLVISFLWALSFVTGLFVGTSKGYDAVVLVGGSSFLGPACNGADSVHARRFGGVRKETREETKIDVLSLLSDGYTKRGHEMRTLHDDFA